MQIKYFTIPARDAEEREGEVNAFLRSCRVLSICREFVADGRDSFWSLCIEYMEGNASKGMGKKENKSRIDYREVLDEREFVLFCKLRDLRKAVAEHEGLPVYAVFTNEQLADMVRKKAATMSAMGEIDGIGEAKLAKYAERFLSVLTGTAS